MTATEAAELATKAETDPEIGHLMAIMDELIRHVATRGGRDINSPFYYLEKQAGYFTPAQETAVAVELSRRGFLLVTQADGQYMLSW